ncbi:MAG: tRNA pseudouridine(55) synthase TruB [Planctomycetes bacterium]|nr:tRNA pseudouridine(55) synthase TruB [Planctomycetota bacterium]
MNKPVGPTSHDIVAGIRRLLPRRTKVGHAGTLDPFANGVLVVCVGPATRLAEFIAAQSKQYLAELTFCATSTTDDSEGVVTPTAAAAPTEDDLRAVLGEFVGEIEQVPPAHSAVHIDGRRAYELARAGQSVDIPTRTVSISSLRLLAIDGRLATLEVDCGKGTYIRALARDIGRRLGCGAYCSALTRTRVGHFALDKAVKADQLTPDNVVEALLPANQAVQGWPTITLEPRAEAELSMGRSIIPPPAQQCPPAGAYVAAINGAGRLVALCEVSHDGQTIHPKKVFHL